MTKNKKKEKETMEFQIQFYESILEKRPDFFEALVALGELYTKKGLYKKGLAVDQRLVRLRPHDPTIFYNLACSYSLLNNCEEAFNALQAAFQFGYDDLPHLERDEDLCNLRKDDRFRRLVSKFKEKSKA